MSTHIETRYASSPAEAKGWDTAQTREALLIPSLFEEGNIRLVYSHYDRFITGGAMPVSGPLALEAPIPSKLNTSWSAGNWVSLM